MPKFDSPYQWPETVEYEGQTYRINHSFDQPYLAGSSRDGKTIFYDRSWEPRHKVDGKIMDRLYPVLIHEVEEKKAEDKGKTYLVAHHRFAEPAERHYIESQGFKWKDYQDSFIGDLRKCEHEKHPHMPSNEEMKPYKGTKWAKRQHN